MLSIFEQNCESFNQVADKLDKQGYELVGCSMKDFSKCYFLKKGADRIRDWFAGYILSIETENGLMKREIIFY